MGITWQYEEPVLTYLKQHHGCDNYALIDVQKDTSHEKSNAEKYEVSTTIHNAVIRCNECSKWGQLTKRKKSHAKNDLAVNKTFNLHFELKNSHFR